MVNDIKNTDPLSTRLFPKGLPAGVKLIHSLKGHTGRIGRLAWSPDGSIIASASEDRSIMIWDAETGDLVHNLNDHSGCVTCISFNSSGSVLASGSTDKTVRFWDIKSGKCVRVLRQDFEVGNIALSPNGCILAIGESYVDSSNRIKVCELKDGGERIYQWHQGAVNDIKFDSQARVLATAGDDKKITLWGVSSVALGINNKNSFIQIEGHFKKVTSVAFDPLGKTLASVSSDNVLKLWEVETGKLLRSFEGHTSPIKCVTFGSNGSLVASNSEDGTFRIWRVDTGSCVASIPEKPSKNRLSGLVFHPQKPLLATVGTDISQIKEDSVIHVWGLDLKTLFRQPDDAVTYVSAKVVLVGESNVGKSYLSHRIATGEPPKEGSTKTTHGMKLWALEPERLSVKAKGPEGHHREVFLWDMGGQEEYRLIHQLFMHDTNIALILLDPTRGATAFKEVESWNNYLEKQLSGRNAIKFLVGAKVDEPCNIIDVYKLELFLNRNSFAKYLETSAITGRGMTELCEAIANIINWDMLGQTTRPELFQRIREEIETRRKSGEVVLHNIDLLRALSNSSPTDDDLQAVDSVTEQLAKQGVLARSSLSSGEPVLVLQVQEIERYAGSLIIAARDNPRGVPTLDLQAIAQVNFILPGINDEKRLPRIQEKTVLECTVQLMLEHGICFQHDGLLVFPTLFPTEASIIGESSSESALLYYDFAGAIDNIYASLISWLVLAQDFGKVRLWAGRAEFEVKDLGLCGVRKVVKPGGFARMDVYFDPETPAYLRQQFTGFVEDHLTRSGVDISEHLTVKCDCGHQFTEETLRTRIDRGNRDVRCPICEKRHNLVSDPSGVRHRNMVTNQHIWALRTQVEKRREEVARHALQILDAASTESPITRPIRLLHLSDLHFDSSTSVPTRLQWLLDDIKLSNGLDFKDLDYLVISGDLTDKGSADGFEKAHEFLSGLAKEFGLSAERCVIVPGNHDIVDFQEAYDWAKTAEGYKDGEWLPQGNIFLVRNHTKYRIRFKAFSDGFYHKFTQIPYPLEPSEQAIVVPFWDTGLQFLALNSSWQIDEFFRKRSGVNVEAVATAIKAAQKQETEARISGKLPQGKPLLRIAVWHHSINGPEQMRDLEFLGNLCKSDVKIIMHGDVHEMRREQIGYAKTNSLQIVGSGSFGARSNERPESTPRLYNLLEISRDLKSVRIHTRCQAKKDGPWDGWHEWPDPDGGKGRLPYYDITL